MAEEGMMINNLVLVATNPSLHHEIDKLNEEATRRGVLWACGENIHAVVTQEYPEYDNAFYQVTLCSSYVESDGDATSYDRLISREVSGLPYSLMAHTDIVGYVVSEQIVKVLAEIPTSIYDSTKGVFGEWGGEPLGTELRGVLDYRWMQRVYHCKLMHIVGAEGTARLLATL